MFGDGGGAMKWLFLLLLIGNLVIFGWGFQREQSADTTTLAFPAALGDLRLLSEAGTIPTSVQLPSQDLLVGETIIENIPQGPAAENEEPTVVVEIMQENESDSEERQEQAVVPKKTVTMSCGAFGPLEYGSRARSILGKLLQADIKALLRSETRKKTIGYWVIIPPLESQAVAIKMVKELGAQGVKDIRRFLRGDRKNGISLGVFSKQGNAEKRQQELTDKGQPTEVQPGYIDAPLYWVDYRAEEILSEKMSRQLLEQYPKLKLEIYSCSSIVTPSGIF